MFIATLLCRSSDKVCSNRVVAVLMQTQCKNSCAHILQKSPPGLNTTTAARVCISATQTRIEPKLRSRLCSRPIIRMTILAESSAVDRQSLLLLPALSFLRDAALRKKAHRTTEVDVRKCTPRVLRVGRVHVTRPPHSTSSVVSCVQMKAFSDHTTRC